jgi:hypothetical protein
LGDEMVRIGKHKSVPVMDACIRKLLHGVIGSGLAYQCYPCNVCR